MPTNPFLAPMPWQCACMVVKLESPQTTSAPITAARRTHEGHLNRCTDCGTNRPDLAGTFRKGPE
jgi:hypothetical protein